MATCAKCGKGKIRKRNGHRKCVHCGFLPEPEGITLNGKPPANPWGSCFDVAAHNLMGNLDIEGMVMCHGVGISNKPGQEGERIAHAWIEFDHTIHGRVAVDPIWLIAQSADHYRETLKQNWLLLTTPQNF